MKTVIGLLFLVVEVWSSPAHQSMTIQNDGSYQFAYETSKESGSHSRSETKGPDGLVIGKYAFEDPTGDFRIVNYRAGDFGYVAKGAVSVAGAPESQFPAEPVEAVNDSKDEPQQQQQQQQFQQQQEKQQQDKRKQSIRGEEKNNEESSDESSNSDEDDSSSLRAQNPSDDGPPEAFPIGFFDQGFQGLRRLAEPTKEISDEMKTTNTAEEKQATSSKPDDNKTKTPPTEYFPPILPFSNFNPQAWSIPLTHSASDHHSTYVYSYQVPQAHGYYYHY